MNIQFSGAFVSARIKRLPEGGMSTHETAIALKDACQEKDGFILSGKAQRAEVVLLESGCLPELPQDTGMLVVIATDEDADLYQQVKDEPAAIQRGFTERVYEQALVSEKADVEKEEPVKVSSRLEQPTPSASAGEEESYEAIIQAMFRASADLKEVVSSGKATIASLVILTRDEIPELSDKTIGLSVVVTGKDAKEYNRLKDLPDSDEKSAFMRKIYEKALAAEST